MQTFATETITGPEGDVLALHDFGGDGPPALIVHATGFHGPAYGALATTLGADRQVFAVDCRGHGASGIADPSVYSWRAAAHDVLACVDHLGGGPVDMFGHSMGGTLVLLAALARADAVGAAYVYEPIVVHGGAGYAPGSVEFSEGARRRRRSFASRGEILHRYAGRPPLGVLRADALWAYVEYGFVDLPDGTVELACLPETEAATFGADDKPDVAEFAGLGLGLAVGIGTGTDDLRGHESMRALCDVIGPETAIEYSHLEHFGPLQDPLTVGGDILATWRAGAEAARAAAQ